MTQPQAQRALALLQRRQLHGSIVAYRSEYAVETSIVGFTSIRAFQSWLKCQPTLRQKIDAVLTRLEELEKEIIHEPL